jgi:hypothetical protein
VAIPWLAAEDKDIPLQPTPSKIPTSPLRELQMEHPDFWNYATSTREKYLAGRASLSQASQTCKISLIGKFCGIRLGFPIG